MSFKKLMFVFTILVFAFSMTAVFAQSELTDSFNSETGYTIHYPADFFATDADGSIVLLSPDGVSLTFYTAEVLQANGVISSSDLDVQAVLDEITGNGIFESEQTELTINDQPALFAVVEDLSSSYLLFSLPTGELAAFIVIDVGEGIDQETIIAIAESVTLDSDVPEPEQPTSNTDQPFLSVSLRPSEMPDDQIVIVDEIANTTLYMPRPDGLEFTTDDLVQGAALLMSDDFQRVLTIVSIPDVSMELVWELYVATYLPESITEEGAPDYDDLLPLDNGLNALIYNNAGEEANASYAIALIEIERDQYYVIMTLQQTDLTFDESVIEDVEMMAESLGVVYASDSADEGASDDKDTETTSDIEEVTCSARAYEYVSTDVTSATLICPPGCDNDASGTLWGTDVYTHDSSICAAAVHAGAITLDDGGLVTITYLPGQESYEGSERNGITTLDYGVWGGSFSVEAGE